MQPTLAAAEVRQNITQYLATAFALADDHVRDGLADFLNDPDHGIFRGPYLRIRTPFRPADDGWREHLDWVPPDFTPHRHQAEAFRRLSTKHGPAAPTLVTTGTGSGKTESFLLPVLDHCRRERARGREGVKAVLLYPMNALATDQAQRVSELLRMEGMEGVSAGLYVGDVPDMSYPRVATQRGEIRRSRPDLLLTNYKMLDLLLQRPEDLPLWRDDALAYVVVDEFHTYDGAQGTDVAMLLRRLAAATGHSRPGAALGDICPVATSATLGNGPADSEESSGIREVAATVFGTAFPPESVIAEDRLTAEEFISDIDYRLPIPNPLGVANLPDPHGDPAAMRAIMAAFTDRDDLTPHQLGETLRTHILTQAVLDILGNGVRTLEEILETLPRRGAYTWGQAIRAAPPRAAEALARFVALLSTARDPASPPDGPRPLLHVETHLWVRSVSRVLRGVAQDRARFAWYGEPEPPTDRDTTVSGVARGRLPAVYCRHCGRSGWAAISPESDPGSLDADPERTYRAAIADKKNVRALIWATLAEANQRGTDTPVHVLDGAGTRVRPVDDADVKAATNGELDGAFVLADLGHDADAFRAARHDRCPACRADEGIRFLGAGLAALASVAVTELFTGGQLAHGGETPKTLLFNDSVQDAAHRAGFVANRSYTFSLRELLATGLPADGSPAALNDLIADTVERAGDPGVLACVVPPDLHARAEVDRVLAGEDTGGQQVWDLIAERLAFSAVLEVGLRSRQGRTLELTRTAAAEVALPEPRRLAGVAGDLLRSSIRERIDADTLTALTPGFLRALLERLRIRGGITHHWLRPWADNAGTNRFGTLWGNRPDGMPAFPDDLPPPRFLLDRAKDRSVLDSVAGRRTWYQDFTARALGVEPEAAAGFLARLLRLLHEEGVLSCRTATDGATRVYGLAPGQIQLRRLDEEQAVAAGVCCPVCNWRQTVHPDLLGDWLHLACPRYRCAGRLQPDEDRRFRADYYRHLYLNAPPFRVTAAEHTSQLTRAQRERVEDGFRRGRRHTDPNLLSCSPTLELGIDIGALSAVILGSLPTGPANYVQRAGRAGRRDGNALLLTLVGRGARERYYLTAPREMIAGHITPPGSYPSAVEILRRQYVAYLVDRAARGQLEGVLPLPRRASALFGPSGWLATFTGAALAAGPTAATDFLALFDGAGREVDAEAAAALRRFAESGIGQRLAEAEDVWHTRLEDLRARIQTLDAAIAGLLDSDPQQRRRRRQLRGERGGVARRVAEIGRTSAHGALVELGVLPNYALVDTRTALEATVTWKESQAGPDGETVYSSEVREYERPARRALTEFAPGNYYYVRGYRHEVNGLDLGTRTRPAVRTWRVCPECGFVRTTNARADTSPCPRCRTPRIGDQSAVYEVVEPTRVYARDDRDDALIRDDHDERRRRYHEVRTAVDIPPESLGDDSWRLRDRSFGVEFSRQAVVRHVNLGELRMDRPADTPFAGALVRHNPFHVCRECGGATAGPPALRQTSLSGRVAGGTHHRPWCPSRRGDEVGHQPVVLAHTLTTEALRILVPAATVRVEERGVTFKAAFLAGLAAIYGGALDHLDTTIAAMPAPETGGQRRYLVVYDTLPGGSGYLRPRSGPEGMREILRRAHAIVSGCSCAEDGRRACHRCLLDHVTDTEFDLADRQLAVEMLEELLRDWQADPVTDTSDISLWEQVESELEARFLDGLQAWAGEPGAGRSFTVGRRINDRRTGQLRVTGPDGQVIGWDVRLHNTIKHSRPDVTFVRRDTGQQVAVFLDGYKYHASPEYNRVADDAAKRARLRAHGVIVFQLSWDDMDYWASGQVPADPVWLPYPYPAQQAARDTYRKLGGDLEDLPRYVWTSAVDTLLGFLADPDPERWRARATACLRGVGQAAPVQKTIAGPETLGPALTAALRGERLPAPRPGQLGVLRGTVTAGLEPVLVVNGADNSLSGFVVLDDAAEAVATEEVFRRRWLAWLYWGNHIQFLATPNSDAAQMVRSALADYDPELLAQAGGIGWSGATALAPLSAEERQAVFGDNLRPLQDTPEAVPDADHAEAAAGPGPDPAETDPAWREVLELVEDDSAVESLVRGLIWRHVPLPEVGYELEDGFWQAELAWPDRRIAVLRADQEAERQHFARAGWEVRQATSWDRAELARRLTRKEQ